FSNGNAFDANDNLITCEHGNRLNSPNDVAVKSDGTIWFTDPPYGILSDNEGKPFRPTSGYFFEIFYKNGRTSSS
ncbi:SMP-30/gluconolactonase/LRE family protein, partial [Xanthomonas citri pv. citri]|nr:SMP-30/gluconolactonase/LRE family protein [Xanthomonas citri pv. citri]